MHTCVPTATIHGVLTCGGEGNIRIHVYLQLPYTVNSRVVVGAIYAYMCTYSYHTRCTVHGVPYTVHCTRCTVHGAPYKVNSHVEGAFMCGSYSRVERHSRVEGTFTCGSYSHVEEAFTCGSYSHVQGTFTCGSYSRVRRATKVKFFTPWYSLSLVNSCRITKTCAVIFGRHDVIRKRVEWRHLATLGTTELPLDH